MICTPCSLKTSRTFACSVGHHLGARARLLGNGLADEPVLDVEVGERGLEHARLGLREHALVRRAASTSIAWTWRHGAS